MVGKTRFVRYHPSQTVQTLHELYRHCSPIVCRSCSAKIMKATVILFYLFAFSGLSNCDSSSEQKVSDAANCFTLNLYQQLAEDNENLVCSPFSLDVLLSMLLTGAGGTTAQELSTSLGYSDITVEDMENAFQSKLAQLTGNGDNTLEIANSVWVQQGFSIKQSFKDVVANKFYSQESELNFSGDPHGATEAINSWGNTKTHGLIPKLLDGDLSDDTIMFLANAIYFKGQWASKFEKDNTRPGPFNNNDSPNNPSNVQLMHQSNEFLYRLDPTLGAEILEMNYKGDDMSMVLILPQAGSNITALEKLLTCQTFKSGIGSSTSTIVDVTMPKFDITSSFDLTEPIKNVGIKDIFNPTANFSGIAPNITVTKAVQKAVIKVYEEGSEAAAITGVGVVQITSVGAQPRIVNFRADHPFLYLIRDKRTGLILFMGRVKNLPNAP